MPRAAICFSLLLCAATACADERLLLPVFTDTAGAFGSRFVTELRIYNAGVTTATVRGLEAICLTHCYPPQPQEVSVPAETSRSDFQKRGNPAAVVTEVGNADLHYSLRVRDVSRQHLSLGVNIPVVRESGLRESVVLQGVLAPAAFRARLRVFALKYSMAHVRAYRESDNELLFEQLLQIEGEMPPHIPARAELVLPAMEEPVRISVALPANRIDSLQPGLLWAFVSITNNDTQEMTIVVPDASDF